MRCLTPFLRMYILYTYCLNVVIWDFFCTLNYMSLAICFKRKQEIRYQKVGHFHHWSSERNLPSLLNRHSWLEINQQQLLFVMTAIFSGHILDTFPGRPHYPPPPPKKTHVFHIAHGNLQTLGGQHITCSGSGGKGGNQGVTHREDSLQRICCHIRELFYRKKMSLLDGF